LGVGDLHRPALAGSNAPRPRGRGRLQAELQIGYLFITHDLAVVRQVADRVYVLFKGEVVESSIADAILSQPKHAYTRRLMESVPGAASRMG
jgi:peptide/nickel transport system ATP-binding protein